MNRTLTREDRCDRCSAAAKAVATTPFGELLFCGHHGRAFEPAMASEGIQVYWVEEAQ